MTDEERKARNRERAQARYAADPEKYRGAARARYHANKEQGKARVADWGKRNPEKRAEYQRRWRQNNRAQRNQYARDYWARTRERDADRRKDWALRAAYGIGIDEYRAMEQAQDGCCAICRHRPEPGRRPLCVDHDHDTGAVRGLLCDPCNAALGLFGDDPETLTAAIRYLQASMGQRDVG